jgi:hypothetical protein
VLVVDARFQLKVHHLVFLRHCAHGAPHYRKQKNDSSHVCV